MTIKCILAVASIIKDNNKVHITAIIKNSDYKEAAMLAGLFQAPGAYDPYADPDAAAEFSALSGGIFQPAPGRHHHPDPGGYCGGRENL